MWSKEGKLLHQPEFLIAGLPDFALERDAILTPKILVVSSCYTSLTTALSSNSLSFDFSVPRALKHIQPKNNSNYMLFKSWIASTIIPVPTAISRMSVATRI